MNQQTFGNLLSAPFQSSQLAQQSNSLSQHISQRLHNQRLSSHSPAFSHKQIQSSKLSEASNSPGRGQKSSMMSIKTNHLMPSSRGGQSNINNLRKSQQIGQKSQDNNTNSNLNVSANNNSQITTPSAKHLKNIIAVQLIKEVEKEIKRRQQEMRRSHIREHLRVNNSASTQAGECNEIKQLFTCPQFQKDDIPPPNSIYLKIDEIKQQNTEKLMNFYDRAMKLKNEKKLPKLPSSILKHNHKKLKDHNVNGHHILSFDDENDYSDNSLLEQTTDNNKVKTQQIQQRDQEICKKKEKDREEMRKKLIANKNKSKFQSKTTANSPNRAKQGRDFQNLVQIKEDKLETRSDLEVEEQKNNDYDKKVRNFSQKRQVETTDEIIKEEPQEDQDQDYKTNEMDNFLLDPRQPPLSPSKLPLSMSNRTQTMQHLPHFSNSILINQPFINKYSKPPISNTTNNSPINGNQLPYNPKLNMSLPSINQHIKEVFKKQFQHKSLLDNASLRHFNSSDQRIVSYVELLKQKQKEKLELIQKQVQSSDSPDRQNEDLTSDEQQLKNKLERKLSKRQTIKWKDNMRKQTLRRDLSQSKTSNEIKTTSFADGRMSRFENEGIQYPDSFLHKAQKMNTLQQKLHDLENFQYIKSTKTIKDATFNKQPTIAHTQTLVTSNLQDPLSPLNQGQTFFEEDENDKRNQELYSMLKDYKVCVVPDSKIITIDKLPAFSIIEGNIKQGIFNKKTEFTKQSKQKYQNLNSLTNSTQFYMQLNTDAHMFLKNQKLRGGKGGVSAEEFQSQSVQSKKFNRITGIGACTRVETQEHLEKRIKEIYQKQIIEQQESEVIDQLLGPILEKEIPNFHSLPPMKRLVLALKTKVGQEELKNNLLQSVNHKKTFKEVFEQYHKITTFKKKIGLDNDDSNSNKKRKSNSPFSRKKSIDEQRQLDNLPPDLRFFHKFKSIIRKQIRSMVNNSTLENAYKIEKRKLEIDILRSNEKNKVTQVIINQIESEEAADPKTLYKYNYFKQRIKQLRRHQRKLQEQQLYQQQLLIQQEKDKKAALLAQELEDQKRLNEIKSPLTGKSKNGRSSAAIAAKGGSSDINRHSGEQNTERKALSSQGKKNSMIMQNQVYKSSFKMSKKSSRMNKSFHNQPTAPNQQHYRQDSLASKKNMLNYRELQTQHQRGSSHHQYHSSAQYQSQHQQSQSYDEEHDMDSSSDDDDDEDEISSQELLDNVFFDRKDYLDGAGGRGRKNTQPRKSIMGKIKSLNLRDTKWNSEITRRQSGGIVGAGIGLNIGINISDKVSKLLDDRIQQELDRDEQIIQ